MAACSASCFAFVEPRSNGTRPACTYYVCNLESACLSYMPPGWSSNLTLAYELAILESPVGASLSFLVTPGLYVENLYLHHWNFSDISISVLRLPLSSSSSLPSQLPETSLGSLASTSSPSPGILLGDVQLIGSIVQFYSPLGLNLTLNSVHLVVQTPAATCLYLKSDAPLHLSLLQSRLDCVLHFRSGPRSSLTFINSHITNMTIVVTGAESRLDMLGSAVFYNISWRFGGGSTVDLKYVTLQDTSVFSSLSSPFNVSMFGCIVQAPLNFSADDSLSVSLSSGFYRRVIHSTSSKSLIIAGIDNIFMDYVLSSTLQLQATFWNNSFSAHERSRSPRNQLSAGNLIMLATCQANVEVINNRFWNGTMFLVMAAADSQCTGTFSVISTIRYNIFPSRARNYSIGDILTEPAVPSIGFYPVHKLLPLTTDFYDATLDARQNYWSSESGPFLCCIEEGSGGYTTNQVDVSDWCLDELCNATSGVSLSKECVSEGCKEPFSTLQQSVFYSSFAVGVLAVCIGLVLQVFFAKRGGVVFSGSGRSGDNAVFYANESIADVADQCYRALYIGLAFSMFVSLCTLVNLSVILHSALSTGHAAHQMRVPFRGVIIISVLLCVDCVQIAIVNPAVATLVWIHHQKRHAVKWIDQALTVAYLWSILVLCTCFTLAVWWIPYSGFAELFDPYFLTHPTYITHLIYLPSVLLSLLSLCSIIPIHMINTRVRHFEYSKLHASLEDSLLEQLRHEPELEDASMRLRHWLTISFVTGFVLLSMTVSDILKDPYATFRYLTVLISSILALITIVASAHLTFTYYRVHLMMICLLLFIIWFIGAIQDIVFWIVYIVISKDARLVSDILHILFTTLWVISLATSAILIYRLRENTLTLLPAAIAANLNYHLDRSWNDTKSTLDTSTNSSGEGSTAKYKIRPTLLREIEEGYATDESVISLIHEDEMVGANLLSLNNDVEDDNNSEANTPLLKSE